MIKKSLVAFTILLGLTYSCNKDDDSNSKLSALDLDTYILAGEQTGQGIEYTDLSPDINVEVVNAWNDNDTLIDLDLDGDGTIDFKISRRECHPSMLGADCDKMHILPLNGNEVNLDVTSNWLDTLSYNDTINIDNDWTTDTLTIYGYGAIMGQPTNYFGHWKGVSSTDKYYIGVKVKKNNKNFYGWIGTKAETESKPRNFDFYITDYAILKEY